MPLTKRQLAASIQAATHIGDRGAIAAFLLDDATTFSASNPFARTSVGAQRQIWSGHAFEFHVQLIASLGLPCLLKALIERPNDEPLVQEILQGGPYRTYVYHQGDGCRIIGSVLRAKSGVALPVNPTPPRQRRRRTRVSASVQLDLFAIPLPGDGSHGACERPASLR